MPNSMSKLNQHKNERFRIICNVTVDNASPHTFSHQQFVWFRSASPSTLKFEPARIILICLELTCGCVQMWG
jgi:hypothetical protein